MSKMKPDASARNEALLDNSSKSTEAYAKYIAELQSKNTEQRRIIREL